MSKPVEIEFLMKDGISAGLNKIKSFTESVKSKALMTADEFAEVQRYVLELRNVVALLETQLEDLRLVGQAASPDLDQSQNIAQIESLESQIKELETELKQLQNVSENVKVTPSELPNAQKKFNGLHNSIQQIAREMPSLAMGPQMFFLAISNNLPIFADEVKRAKEEYADLIKNGEKGEPVWKQILSSLFSWQTALTTGIMLLTMYGDEIIQWCKGLVGARNDVDELRKAMELKNEVEKEAYAISVRTRVELNNEIQNIKTFTGTKEQEKNKIEELNRKYGDSFGYYETLAEWYDILIRKSEDYIETLFLQAKAQSYIDKAVKVDEQINEVKSKGKEEYRPTWGEGGKVNMFFGGDNLDHYGSDPAELAFREVIQKLEEEKQGYIKEAEKLQEEYRNNMKVSGLGLYAKTKPSGDSGNDPITEAKKRLELEERMAKELRQLKWENEQAEIDQMKDGSQKRIRQIKLDYEKAISEIHDQEQRWKEAQNGTLTKEQTDSLKQAVTLAYDKMGADVRAVEADEVRKGKDKLNALLDEYKTYDQRRRDIESAYAEDMSLLNTELGNRMVLGGDISQVQSSIQARTDAYRQDIQSLEADILHSTEFYDKLFSDVSEKGYKVLKDFYGQAKEILDNAELGDDSVTVKVPVKDSDGKFVSRAVKLTVAEFERMKQQVDSIQRDLEKKNPFSAFKTSWSELMSAIKNEGDISGSLISLNAKGKELTSTIRGWGDSLGAVFGDRFSNSINEIMTMVDGVMGMGTGIGQIFAGDFVGGISNTLSGLSSIITMISSWKEKNEEMKREWYLAEIETNRALRERNVELAISRDTIQDIITNQEILNWLVEKGYSKPSSVSVWEAQMSALEEYMNNLEAEINVNNELWNSLMGSEAYWEWGNSMNGGSVSMALKGLSAEQIELYYNQGKLTEEAAAYYEAWIESGKSIEELKQNIEEAYASLQEMVMGTSFDGFLQNVKNALRDAQGDVSRFADFTEETISEALLNAFMYQHLAEALEPLYNDLSERLINGTANENYLDLWRENFQNVLGEQYAVLEALLDEMGVDLFSGASQTGKSGSFTAMTQEQGTKLEGLFVSAQMHLVSIDERQEDVAETMSAALGHLQKIEENTSDCKDSLDEINNNIKTIIRDGVKAI